MVLIGAHRPGSPLALPGADIRSSGRPIVHAEGAETAVHRMAVIMFADAWVHMEAAKEIFIQAVDLVVQVGWLGGKRKILGVWETEPEMKAGNVVFRQIYRPGDTELGRLSRQRG